VTFRFDKRVFELCDFATYNVSFWLYSFWGAVAWNFES